MASLLLLSLVSRAENWQPKADENAVVKVGAARFTIMSEQLIRMEYDPSETFRTKATQVVVNRLLPVPAFQQQIKDGHLIINTRELTLTYQLNSGEFNGDNLSVTLNVAGKKVRWFPGLQDTQNLGGTARTLDGMNGGIDWEGKPVDLGQGIISRSGWFLLDDTESFTFSGDKSEWSWVDKKDDSTKNIIDWYFFGHGHQYKQALKDYTAIAGKIPMPPKYAFGYWWSRYWVYSDRELQELMQQTRDYDIPIDVLVIDMDWHLTHGGLKDIKNPKRDPFGELLGWTGYTWNKELFPEPEKFLDWSEEFNLKTALNLHPASGISPLESQYQAFAQDYDFDTTDNSYIPYKLAEKKWAETYVKTVLHPLENQGVDFWWLDWQQYPFSKEVEGLNNTWWLNYVFFSDMERQNKRPLLFHRWGGMGNHRYQIGFSGDDKISWQSLQYQSYFTATASNVGYGYWSHDIGGHASSDLDKDAELYLRWIQFGILSPIFRTHSAKISTIERRFWMYPEHFEPMRELVKLRYALNPYIYNASRQAFDSGVSIVRPMYYQYANHDEAYNHKYQYMFGDDLLVAPISAPVSKDSLLAKQSIWLPEGQWYEWYTGTNIKGGKVVERFYSATEIPLFAKAGSIIPMYGEIEHLQQQLDQWQLTLIPGDSGKATIYEDNGDGLGYKNNEYATTQVSQFLTSAQVRKIIIEPRAGTFTGAKNQRQFTLKLPSTFPVKTVLVNGKVLSANQTTYHAKSLLNEIVLPKLAVNQRIEISIVFEQALLSSEALLNGKIGQFNRVTKAVSDLKVEVARENWWATLPNMLLGAEQTPSKIDYTPENIIELLTNFDNNYHKMSGQIHAHKDIRTDVAKRYVRFLNQ